MTVTKNKNAQYGAAYFFGILFLLFGILVITWNINRAKGRTERDNQVISQAVEVDPTKVDSANEGKYVIIYGSLLTDQVFDDQYFDIKYSGVAYIRMAEVSTEDTENNEYEYGYWSSYGDNYATEYTVVDSATTGVLKYKAVKPVKIQAYTIDPKLFEFDRLLFQPIFLDKLLKPETNPEYYLKDDNIVTNASDPEYPEIGAMRYTFYGVPNGFNVTLLGIQKGDSIIADYNSEVLPGIRNKTELFENIIQEAKGVESAFNYLSLFFLPICALALSFLIKERKLPDPMHPKVFQLRLGRLFYIILLTILLFHGILGLSRLIFSGEPMSSFIHFGYVLLIVVATKVLFGYPILPKFLFKKAS